MEIQFSPTNNLNLIQRNLKSLKKFKIKSKRYLNQDKNINKLRKVNRTCNQIIF